MNDYGGWLWLLTDVGFVLVLLVALVYGVVMWRRRSHTAHMAGEREAERLAKQSD